MQQLLQEALQLHRNGEFAAAAARYDRLLQAQPRNAEVLQLRGTLAAQCGELRQAAAYFERALQCAPGHAVLWNKRGIVLQELRSWDDALASYERALAIQPDMAEALSNRGVVLQTLKQWGAALASFDRALTLRPDDATTHYNRGNVLRGMQRLDDALASYDRALALAPADADAHCNRGSVLQELGRWEEALASFEKAHALQPALSFLAGDLLRTRMQLCDWRDFDAAVGALAAGVEKGLLVTPCHPLLGMVDAPAVQRRAAAIWVAARSPADPALGPLATIAPRAGTQGKGRLHIGYFSADFRNHPVSYLLAQVLESHDRTRFEVSGFSLGGGDAEEMRRRVAAACERFVDVRTQSDREVARLARSLGVDIAVDLTGYTTGGRSGIFALRAAPLQVNWLGYAGTLGADYIDYLIADPVVLPEASFAHYAEQPVWLSCFMPHDATQVVSATPERAALGLPPQAVVLCCFTNAYKITPAVFGGWMRILAQVPDSVLWLSPQPAAAMRNLRAHAAACGMDPSRIVFAARIEKMADHLARLGAADLFLDTHPYNAHASAMDALWAGLPVLTRMGSSFASRVAGSLLHAAGLPELVTVSAAEYESRALMLAGDPAQLTALRMGLQQTRAGAPLFDTQRFTRELEAAYEAMCARHHAGLPPQAIDVRQG